MRRLQAFALLSALLFSFPAFAQSNVTVNFRQNSGTTTPVSPAQPLPITGSFSAGTFAPGGAYATLTATGSSADAALPAGAAVIAFNTGTTAVSCQLTIGSGVATASMNVIQASSWLGFTVGSNTHISCIDQTGSTSNVVVVSGGSGSPTGAGGGGGSGGGGAITMASGAVASGAYSAGSLAAGAGVDGWNLTEGSIADAAWSGSGNASIVAALKAIYGAAITGTAVNGATYPASSIGIGWKDGSGNIQPFAAATPAPVETFLGTTATVNEPCRTGTHSTQPISQTASAIIVTHSASLKTYVCAILVNASDAENLSIIEGTGTVCATSSATLVGGSTAATGLHFAANGGFARGNGDYAVIRAKTGGDDICLLQSGSGTVAGWADIVQQ